MPASSLVKKLLLKPDYRYLLINPPEGYLTQLGELPPGVQLTEKPGGVFDLVQIFVKSKADLDALGEVALESVKPNGLLWVSYPKKTSKIKTDISRDCGWESLQEAGWGGVAMIAIDDTWSAMRLKPGGHGAR
jgi:hypothetical protein